MKSHSASITVEASFSLSLFLLSMIMLMTPLLILNRSIKISCLLEKNARYLSMYKYLEHYGLSKTELNDVPQIETVLTVGETEDSAVSNMVIVSSGEERTLQQVEKQLNKKLDIIKVRTFQESQGILRELLMVKLRYKRDNRKDIMENCQILGATIVELSKSQMVIEMCDTPERINMFLETLKSVSILECARTGTLAMLKIAEGS